MYLDHQLLVSRKHLNNLVKIDTGLLKFQQSSEFQVTASIHDC